MRRWKFLLGSAFSAAAFSEPVGRHSLAQRYAIQALDLAMAAGDRLYAADVVASMSRLIAQMGYGALSEYERLRNVRQTIALAWAGLSIAHRAVTPALAAQLHAFEARGHALLGDANATRRVVLEAERHYERSRPEASHRGWASTPKRRPPRTSARACATSTNPTRRPS